MSKNSHGRVVWHDLVNTKADQAEKFYTQLFGWRVEKMDMGGPTPYRMLFAGEVPFAGIQEEKESPANYWLASITVPDVDAALKRVPALGGKVYFGPADIPHVGRFGIIGGPQGETIAAIKLSDEKPEPAMAPLNTFCWVELLAHDPAKACAFHAEIFGWKVDTVKMDLGGGHSGEYRLLKRKSDGKEVAGSMQLPPEAAKHGAPTHFLAYVHVADVDATVNKAKSLGAQVHAGPMDIPNVGRMAVLQDPTGANFALYKPAQQG